MGSIWVATDVGRATYTVKLFREGRRPNIHNDGRWYSQCGEIMSTPQSPRGLERNSLPAPGQCIEFRRVGDGEQLVPIARVLEIVENKTKEPRPRNAYWDARAEEDLEIIEELREEFGPEEPAWLGAVESG